MSDDRGFHQQTIECKFCGHWYINPCDAKRAQLCRNVRKGAPAKVERVMRKKAKRR